MYNQNTKKNKLAKHGENFGIENTVNSPKDFSTQKTAIFGALALFSVLLLNVPVFVENTCAYGTDSSEFNKESEEVRNLVRNGFVNPNVDKTISNVDDSNEFKLLDERSHLRNNFSYDHPDKINEKSDYVRTGVILKR